jgi:hypothetical protein
VDLESASAALAIPGIVVPNLKFDGRSFASVIEVDRREASRRERHALRPVLEPSILNAMSTLPHGLPVSRRAVDPVCQAVLDVAPPGLVSSRGDSLVRLWRPAVRIRLLLVTHPNWRLGLSMASMFAADGPRALVANRVPQDVGSARVMAERLGAGLVLVPAGEEPRVLAWPSLRWRGRSSTRHWQLLEVVYDGWRSRSGRDAQALR